MGTRNDSLSLWKRARVREALKRRNSSLFCNRVNSRIWHCESAFPPSRSIPSRLPLILPVFRGGTALADGFHMLAHDFRRRIAHQLAEREEEKQNVVGIPQAE